MFSWEAEYLSPPKNISSNSDFCETTTNGSSTWSTLNGQYKKLLFLIQDILSYYLPWSSKQLITLFIWTLSVQFYQKFVFKKTDDISSVLSDQTVTSHDFEHVSIGWVFNNFLLFSPAVPVIMATAVQNSRFWALGYSDDRRSVA